MHAFTMPHISNWQLNMPQKKNGSTVASWCKIRPISGQPDAVKVTTKTNKKQASRKPAVKKHKPPPPPEPWVDQDDCMEIPANDSADAEFSWMDHKVDEDALVEEEEAASDVFHDGASSCNGSIDGMSDDQVSETSHTESDVTRSSVSRKATVQYDGPELEVEAEVL